MAGAGPKDNEVFNIERIQSLVELMEERGLNEIDLRHGDQRIRLRRGMTKTTVTQAMQPAHFMPPQAPVAAASTGDSASLVEHGKRADDDASIVLIKSPMVGTYYSRSNPEAESFVKVGDHISAEQTVCIIEAMKVFNPIQAEVSGKVIAVLVSDEEPVDFGKPLFKVDTSA